MKELFFLIVQNFTGRLHLGLGKFVQFWFLLMRTTGRRCPCWILFTVTPWYNFSFACSSATAYLAQKLVKTEINLGQNYLLI
jgi:hypothetical protein